MNKKLDRNYYDTLEVERTADEKTIKKAYKRLVLIYHPDKGGTDEMFQQLQESFQVLSDGVKRADYDKDLKKYNLKDGMKKKGTTSDSMGFKQSTTKTQESFKQAETDSKLQKQQSFMEIPSNLSSLSVKELKQIMEQLNIRGDDCVEKNDIINRIKEYQEKKSQKPTAQPSAQPRRQDSEPTMQGKENKKPSGSATYSASSSNPMSFSCMPPVDSVSFKIISVGNSEVGKSCLIKRYCEEKFVERYISTIGIDYGVKKLKIKGQPVAINFFDMSGNEEYKVIRTDFYQDVSGVMMVFDLDNRDSYNSLIHWEDEMKKNGVDLNRSKVVVCGNKSDSKGREINSKEAQKWAKQKGFEYFDTSAQTGQNVGEAFLTLFESCYTQFLADKKQFGL